MAVIYFFFALGSLIFDVTSSLGGEPFNSIKASQETIVNYEVVHPTVVMNGYLDPYPSEITVDFSTSTANYSLEFKQNPHLNSSEFVSILIDEYNNQVIDENEYPNCYYIGTVKDHPDWVASMAACHGLQLEFGDTKDKENYFHLEPLDKTDTNMIQSHAFYRESEYEIKERTLGCKSPEGLKYPKNHFHQRVRRKASTYYVELVAVNDDAQFAAFGRNVTATVQRTLSIANGMNNLYIRGFGIRVVLTKVITITAGNPFAVSNDVARLFDSFESYANNVYGGLGGISRDSIMLLTGVHLTRGAVGLAVIGTMCTSRSVILTQDGGTPLASVITIATHEMGHTLNMFHDNDPGKVCRCSDPVCIMASYVSSPPATRFSDCSASDLSWITYRLGCLENVPTTIQGGPRCGNGIVEDGENCDCGEPGFCSDPCCNASTCQWLPSDTVCRKATRDCDIAEYCTGSSGECPQDVIKINGSPCASDTGYCINGNCPTLRDQCMKAWGTTESLECFPHNIKGDHAFNCGFNYHHLVKCSASDTFCGTLHCSNGHYRGIYGISGYLLTVSWGHTVCKSFLAASSGVTNPGLVNDGTRCGTNKVCISRKCRDLSTLYSLSCPVGDNGLICSGSNSGICNNLGKCSCLPGFTGLKCDAEVSTTPSPAEEVSTESLKDIPTTDEVATNDLPPYIDTTTATPGPLKSSGDGVDG